MGDHTKSTKKTCPLHPDYVGHLKAGGKPKGVKGDSEEAEEWTTKQRDEKLRREAISGTPGQFVCRNEGCEGRFQTKQKRLVHEIETCLCTRDGGRR